MFVNFVGNERVAMKVDHWSAPIKPGVIAMLAVLSLSACGSGSSAGATGAGQSSQAALAATSAGTSGANSTGNGAAPSAAFQMPANGPLTPGLEAEIGKSFAPQFRFNGYHDDGNKSVQNRNEDHFPQGVASFLREIESGKIRILLLGSIKDTPALTVVIPYNQSAKFGNDDFGDFPKRMVGDAPGKATTYTHIYLEPGTPALNSDGSGELIVWAEYWEFYPQDRSEAELLTVLPTYGYLDLSGHRGDWEHQTFKIRVQLDAGLTFLGGRIEAGYYSGHGDSFKVVSPELELVDDKGQPDLLGRHPVVYISQGKHAAYPQAGQWADHADIPSWLASHTDFFRGNGAIVNTWDSPLADIGEPSSDINEFASVEFLAMIARSPGSNAQMKFWTDYRGDWGTDDVRVNIPALGINIGIAGSPSCPDLAGAGFRGAPSDAVDWTTAKNKHSKLIVYKDKGVTIPQVIPAPIPRR
jgi:hypothetical protein